jgi:GntR family transcriptional regulator, transcriptional repressor for pyruvate dehydrogenase complex
LRKVSVRSRDFRPFDAMAKWANGMSMQFEKLSVLSAYQVVSRELRRMILSGDLKTGDQLPTELQLAEQLGVNRSTVREGIRQLENEGLVRRKGRERLRVSVPDSRDLAPRAIRAMVMHQVTFRELWEAALVLEPACASLSAANHDDKIVAALENNLQGTRHFIENVQQCTEFDTEFHALVAEGVHNKALLLSRAPIGLLLYSAFERLCPLIPQARDRMLKAHDNVTKAIREGNSAEAELWMRKHIIDFRRGWEMAALRLDLRVELPRAVAES